MSHLTTYQSNNLINCKKALLKKAVADLGMEVDFEIKLIKNTWITESVDAGLIKDGQPIAVGFKFIKEGKNTRLELAGDFWGTGIEEKSLINKLAQAYKKHDVIYQCKQQGWTVDKENIRIDNKTNEIVINASRYIA